MPTDRRRSTEGGRRTAASPHDGRKSMELICAMRSTRWMFLVIAAILLAFAGCAGDDGAAGPAGEQGPPGPPGPPGQAATTFETAVETCAVCHGPNGSLVDTSATTGTHAPAATDPTTRFIPTITEVNINASEHIEVVFQVLDESANPKTDLAIGDFRIVMGELNPPAGAGDNQTWTRLAYGRNSTSLTGFDTTGSATGDYAVTFASAAATPQVFTGITGTASNYRIAIQVSGNVDNDVVDFPGGIGTGAQSASFVYHYSATPQGTPYREVVATQSCNECHGADPNGDGLKLHGSRFQVEFCVLCHDDGVNAVHTLPDALFNVMIHKIHAGKALQSSQAGDPWTFHGIEFGKGGFPQEITNCQKCHDNTVANDADNWMDVPTMETCGSCHDRTWFGDPALTPAGYADHLGGQQTTNAGCAGVACHSSDLGLNNTIKNPQNAHRWSRIVDLGDNYQYFIDSAVYDSGTGQVTVTFRVTDGGADDDLTGAPWTDADSNIRLNFGWKSEGKADYTNFGSGSSTPGGPTRVTVLDGGVLNASVGGDLNGYTYVYTLPTDGQAAGTGIVVMEGHPAAVIVPGQDADTLPVVGDTFEFAINEAAADTRRVQVDTSKCMACHDTLSIHGENRTVTTNGDAGPNNIDVALCTTCHNSAATDINRRPSGSTVDGKPEEAVDFKRMIHRIHKGREAASGGVVIYGFRGPNVFAGEMPVGTPVNACGICHETELPTPAAAADNYLPPLAAGMEGTTIITGNIASHADDINISQHAATCSGCHDDLAAITHMQIMGASFMVVEEHNLTGEEEQP